VLCFEVRCDMMKDEFLRSEASLGEAEFRRSLSCFATGITVVTTSDHQGQTRAMTVNTFTSVSLDPPLVLYCLGNSAFHFHVFARAESFAVNVLHANQQVLSDRFSREHDDDLADLKTGRLSTGSPVLLEALTALDCTMHAKHEAGDHLIILGEVQAIKNGPRFDPLLFFRSEYRALRPSADG